MLLKTWGITNMISNIQQTSMIENKKKNIEKYKKKDLLGER
jgi:hypothetical protein